MNKEKNHVIEFIERMERNEVMTHPLRFEVADLLNSLRALSPKQARKQLSHYMIRSLIYDQGQDLGQNQMRLRQAAAVWVGLNDGEKNNLAEDIQNLPFQKRQMADSTLVQKRFNVFTAKCLTFTNAG